MSPSLSERSDSPLICSSEFRMRTESADITCRASSGVSMTMRVKSSLSSTRTVTSSSAFTVALRGFEFRIAISPKNSPGPKRASSTSALRDG